MYRTLDADKITATIRQLEARIEARFPGSSLARVAAELGTIATADRERARWLNQPNWMLRIASGLAVLAGLGLLIALARLMMTTEINSDAFGRLQGFEALLNICVLVGGAVWFMLTMEVRQKRAIALRDLHSLRAIVHVIDMHQLTKDPSALMAGASETTASPPRHMTTFELNRYLDYCSEMFSLTAKVAALYAQSTTDAVVLDTVNDLETLTTNLSQKVWQKITLITSPAATPAPAKTPATAGLAPAPHPPAPSARD
jgi:hypothetical protein